MLLAVILGFQSFDTRISKANYIREFQKQIIYVVFNTFWFTGNMLDLPEGGGFRSVTPVVQIEVYFYIGWKCLKWEIFKN